MCNPITTAHPDVLLDKGVDVQRTARRVTIDHWKLQLRSLVLGEVLRLCRFRNKQHG